ncbi:RES family NAD+ phosphorylase [Crenothrix sp.]|uniref:RES family NAD+ phosphorylase n=1 Tax=Crenothrix sp. TaxID=3100433 RepID=UPI00374D5CFC
MPVAIESIACSKCFMDRGLQLDAEQLGDENAAACQNCGSSDGYKLNKEKLGSLAYRFFVWGSFWQTDYGGAPLIHFNEYQTTSIEPSPWLKSDVELFEKLLGIGFFHYGPRLWMMGEVEPLKALQKLALRPSIVERIVREYPTREIEPTLSFYRIRKDPKFPSEHHEYDSPPAAFDGTGRLDSNGSPALYASPDLQVCVHECRVTAEDELYVATLAPTRKLRLLDLSVILQENNSILSLRALIWPFICYFWPASIHTTSPEPSRLLRATLGSMALSTRRTLVSFG